MSDPQRIDIGIDTALESLHRTMKANPRDDLPEPKSTLAKIVQLAFWREQVRGAPNTVLRSALFAAIHSKKRQRLGIPATSPDQEPEGITIAAQEGISIKYYGTQLNQYDADVFFEALHRTRGNPLPTECIFTGCGFLRVIGRSNAAGNYKDLDNSLRRLRDGRFEIDWKAPGGKDWHYEGGLIADFEREENSKLYKVAFSKNIVKLFAPACWTKLEWAERMALKGKPLAQWLHGFYSTHAICFPLSVAYLHEKSGSARSLLKYFRRDLKNALADLEKILGWKAAWDDDLLTIDRKPSASQIHHLNRKAGQRKRLSKSKPKGLTATPDLFPREN
jgi:hypothetical protein